MTLLLVLLVLLPWSIWRQMHAHEITRESLVKLPLIFAAIGLLGVSTKDVPTDAAAVGYLAVSVVLSVFFGIWRGRKVTIWRDDAERWMSQGNRLTLTLWVALLATKFGLGTVASITDWFPGEHAGEVFMFLAVSFVAQNLVVASRSLWTTPRITEAVPA